MEAIVAATITAVGVAATLKAIGAIEYRQAVVNEQETMLNLAREKYEEIVAVQDFTTPSGDFTDQSDTEHLWQMTLTPVTLPSTSTTTTTSSTTAATVNTGNTGELETLRVTVHPSSSNSPSQQESVSGLVWVSQQALNGTSSSAGAQ